MAKILEYRLVKTSTNQQSSVVLDSLVEEVEKAAADNWKPVGGVTEFGGFLIQAMIRTSISDF